MKKRNRNKSHECSRSSKYAKENNYKVMEDYGVMGVAPFIPERAKVWLGYLKVPYDEPIEVYRQGDNKLSWVAEWSVK